MVCMDAQILAQILFNLLCTNGCAYSLQIYDFILKNNQVTRNLLVTLVGLYLLIFYRLLIKLNLRIFAKIGAFLLVCLL